MSASASTTVLGVGTRFLSELEVGDVIAVMSDPTDFATVVSIESDTSLTVNTPIGDGTASEIIVKRTEPITLVHLARQPNGRAAQIVGTPSTLYRYQANEDGAYARDEDDTTYVDGDYFASDYVQVDTAHAYFAEDYTDESPGAWRIIGRRFSKSAQRWEAVNINGFSVFNNGVDLPVSYRVEDEEVKPIYELRENGVASVGTIAAYNGILIIADIAEIFDTALADLFAHESSDAVTASQTGSTSSGSITASRVGLTNQVVASSNFFTAPMVGRTITFVDGFSAAIVSVDDPTHATLDAAPVGVLNLRFTVIDEDTDYLLSASGDIFTGEMRGRLLFFANGVSRRILEVVSPTVVRVDYHTAIASQTFLLENQTAYSRFTNDGQMNRIQYRMAWAIPDEPRRFAAVLSGSIHMGSRKLELDLPVKSLEIGMSVTIVGAGADGGDFTSQIVFVGSNRTTITLHSAAGTTVSGALLQATDSVGSIVSYEDLQDDSSAIIRCLPLKNALVIYKDGSIFLCRYTAIPEAPFDFGQQGAVYRGVETPHYRNTLISINDEVHFYAGRNHFFVFDIASRRPTEHLPGLNAADLFFDHASLDRTNEIWAANNGITQEIFVGLPVDADTEDRLLCFDYHYETASTSSMRVTAAGTVKRPVPGRATGVVEDWFVMGDAGGRVLLYGLADQPQEQWGGAMAIFNRAGEAYDSILKGGLWGGGYNEADLTAYVPELSSFGRPQNAQVELTIFGYRNAAELPRTLVVVVLEAPTQFNCPTMFFRECYFQDQLKVSGANNPCRLAARTVEVSPVASRSYVRVREEEVASGV